MSSSLEIVENSQPKKPKTTDPSMPGTAGRSDDFLSQPSTSSVSCFLCSFAHTELRIVEEHMNNVHFGPLISSAEPDPPEETKIDCSMSMESFSDAEAPKNNMNAMHNRLMNGGTGKMGDMHCQPSTSSFTCLMCSFKDYDSNTVEEHMNRVHFDQSKPTIVQNSHQESEFSCPMCPETFLDAKELKTHVNRKHKDILSPIKAQPSTNDVEAVNLCPVCSAFSSDSYEELQRHIDHHFSNKDQSDTTSDHLIAEHVSKERQVNEDREFERLKAVYGMNETGDFKKQSTNNMQKAVRSGQLTISEYYEKQNELRSAEYRGVDDGSSCVRDVIPRIREKSRISSHVAETYVCSNTDFYGYTYGDKGWGCGYRNIQMLLSALSRNKMYSELLLKHSLSSNSNGKKSMGNLMPSISKIQKLIECAWETGFDVKGREQLNGKLCGTKKWIGATEVVSLLSSMRIKCELIDTLRPTVAKLHYRMFEWIVSYFKKEDTFKPPLYLQHDGHSRTIIGVEISKNGEVTLLILDPGIDSYKIESMLTSSNPFSMLKLIRRSLSSMVLKQYQIVSVTGVISSKEEYEAHKVLRSTKIQ